MNVATVDLIRAVRAGGKTIAMLSERYAVVVVTLKLSFDITNWAINLVLAASTVVFVIANELRSDALVLGRAQKLVFFAFGGVAIAQNAANLVRAIIAVLVTVAEQLLAHAPATNWTELSVVVTSALVFCVQTEREREEKQIF